MDQKETARMAEGEIPPRMVNLRPDETQALGEKSEMKPRAMAPSSLSRKSRSGIASKEHQ